MRTENQAAVYNNEDLFHSFMRSQYEMPAMAFGFTCTWENWDAIQKYEYYFLIAREIERCLMTPDANDAGNQSSFAIYQQW